MLFEIVGDITNVEIIATGRGIKRLKHLRKRHGGRTEDQTLLGLTTMRVQKATSSFVLCVRDDGSEDLEQRKLYQVLPDRAAAREGYLRIVDESGEDYLYPSNLFVALRLPAAIARRLMSAAPQNVGIRGSAKLRLRARRA